MAIQGIEGVLQQLQATAMSARSAEADTSAQANGASFAGELKAALGRISDTQNTARTKAEQFELGTSGVGLNDVMVDMQKANVSLQMGVQVRNKLVAAYQDIMSMQV